MARRKSLAAIVRDHVPTLSVSTKRRTGSRTGVENWYPYYAGYTEEFAHALLSRLPFDEPLRILDPWNGSGTTTRVAHQLGHIATGFDINPVVNIVASAKVVHPEDAAHVSGFARRLANLPPEEVADTDPLNEWLPFEMVAQYRSIESAVLRELGTTHAGEVVDLRTGFLPPLAAFLLLGLIRTARANASIKSSTNPTWIRPSAIASNNEGVLGDEWIGCLARMRDDLLECHLYSAKRVSTGKFGVADSRRLPIDDSSVDFVLTSPPYCTRIDYIVNSSFELAALGIHAASPEYQRLRRYSMGTPLSRDSELPEIPDDWPASVKAVLSKVRNHASKASHSYYYRNFWQYFDDTTKSLAEISRVLDSNGGAALVVQSSYYKDIEIDLPSLYVDCANAVSLKAGITSEVDVRRSLASINTKSQKHFPGKKYREAVVVVGH